MESYIVRHRICLLLRYNQHRNKLNYIILRDKMYLDILLFRYQDQRGSHILILQWLNLSRYCLYFFGMQKIIKGIPLSLPALFILFIFLLLFQLQLHGNSWSVSYIPPCSEVKADLKQVIPWPKTYHYSLAMPSQVL